MKLLVLLVVLALRRLDFSWPVWLQGNDRFDYVLGPVRRWAENREAEFWLSWLAQVLMPVVIISVFLCWISGWLWGLVGFVAAVVLLLWLLGGRSEFRDVEELLVRGRMNDPEELARSAQYSFAVSGEPGDQGYFSSLMRGILRHEAIHLFATLFWLIALGYWMALLYVLNYQWLRQQAQADVPRLIHTTLLWIPARLLVLCLALGGNFGRVADAVSGRVWQLENNEQLLEEALAGALDRPALEDPDDLPAGVDQVAALQGLLQRCMAMWLIMAAIWVVMVG